MPFFLCNSSSFIAFLSYIAANCVSGKLHQRLSCFYDVRICTSKQQFLRYLKKSNFFDYRFLSSSSCLILQDEKIVSCTNIASIPGMKSRVSFLTNAIKSDNATSPKSAALLFNTERVYKLSKLFMWQKFAEVTSRKGYFARAGARLAFMDTDSKQRCRTSKQSTDRQNDLTLFVFLSQAFSCLTSGREGLWKRPKSTGCWRRENASLLRLR